MSIMRWEPFSEMTPLREMMNRLMEESFIMPRWMTPTRELMATCPIDVYETENDVIVKAALPGMRPEDIDVRITDAVLTIKGEHKEERESGQPMQQQMAGQQGQPSGQHRGQQGQTRPNYYRREMSYGSIFREITLPTDVQADKAQASFENGILTLTLPKAEQAKAKRIQVQVRTGGQQGQPRIQQGS